MPAELDAGVEIDAHLDDLASGHAEIVPLEIGALDPRLLRLRHVQRHTESDDKCSRHDGLRSSHLKPLLELMTSGRRAANL